MANQYPTSIVAWDKNEDGSWISGILKVTPEFLEELIEAYDNGDPDVVDEYNDEVTGYIKVSLNLNLQDSGNVDYLGNLQRMTDKGKKKKSRSARPSGRRNEVDPDEIDFEDEPPRRSRSSSRSSGSSRSKSRSSRRR